MKLAKVIWHLGKYCDFPAGKISEKAVI